MRQPERHGQASLRGDGVGLLGERASVPADGHGHRLLLIGEILHAHRHLRLGRAAQRLMRIHADDRDVRQRLPE